ncbi:RNA polymerase sigma-70 factor [candidate division KSB1 bacterium]|nr:RNA polymerase sigma-70 factor [candidate division KSB1 bacterium]
MPDFSDIQLIKAIKDSNVDAFETLYYRYYKPLYFFAWSRTNSSEASKEIVQEIFTRVWDTRNRLNSNKSIKSYLYRIAHNIIIDHSRKQKVHTKYVDSEREKFKIAEDENAEFLIKLNQALQELPEKYRSVFLLSRVQDYTYKEIADMYSVSTKTVQNRINKALKILRKELSG